MMQGHIDQFDVHRTGWARFSDDSRMRYRLGRSLVAGRKLALRPVLLALSPVLRSDLTTLGAKCAFVTDPMSTDIENYAAANPRRAVFLMLNPSKANAFIVDPTVGRGIAFAKAWGCEIYEAANINALMSTDPQELYKQACGSRGDDHRNNMEIVAACTGAHIVIAGWGKHGALDGRGELVRRTLSEAGIRLHHLGLNKDGSPKHPLYIKGGTEPKEWT